jgi:hypothetical protein
VVTFKIDIFNLYKEFQKLKRTVPKFLDSGKNYEINFFPREEDIPVKLLSEKGILIISNNSIIKSWILELASTYENVQVTDPENIKPFTAWLITPSTGTLMTQNGSSTAEQPR